MKIVFPVNNFIVNERGRTKTVAGPVAIGSHSGRHRVGIDLMFSIVGHKLIIACRLPVIRLLLQAIYLQSTKLFISFPVNLTGSISGCIRYTGIGIDRTVCQVIVILKRP